jgi:hypothetical protein
MDGEDKDAGNSEIEAEKEYRRREVSAPEKRVVQKEANRHREDGEMPLVPGREPPRFLKDVHPD